MKTNFKMIHNISVMCRILVAIILFSSCKKDTETTQVPQIPGFPVNTTISKLIEKEGVVNTESVVWGFVSAVGVSQNLPLMVAIQDDGAGLIIKVEENELERFTPGTLVFVKAKGLAIKKEDSFTVLTRPDGKEMNADDIEASIGFGAKSQKVPVTETDIEHLDISNHQRLVTIKDVEVANEYIEGNFGPDANNDKKEILLQDCAGNEVVVITYGNSDIASTSIPEGRGNLTGFFTINNNRKELRLLDENAADGLTQVRCAGSGDITLTREISKIIAAGEGSTIPAGTELKVVNISTTVSETNGGITVQDASGGIFIAGVSTANYPLDAALIINVGNKQLASVNGRLAITGVTNTDIQIAGTYDYPSKITSIANMLNGNMGNTLVEINNLAITLYDDFSTEKVYRIRDNTGKIHMTLLTSSNITLTEGTVSVKGYFTQQNGENKFMIRQQSDVTYKGTAPNPDPDYIVETFKGAYRLRKDNGSMVLTKGYYYYSPTDPQHDNYMIGLSTGKWLFYGVLMNPGRVNDMRDSAPCMLGKTSKPAPGTAYFPENGPGYIESQFGYNGLKRIKVEFGSKYNNTTPTLRYTIEVKISIDEGVTWTSLGTKYVDGKGKLAIADFSPNIPRAQKVRVQVLNQSDGAIDNWGTILNVLSITVEQPEQ
ncbi:DUF5689 domain-containing protein [Pseudopedobacter sp.]|uniref:DUF5689 domain-containing protein n=1 Tax=Pseudopedobacter sp. TaxID=1936787 RepID=UPI00333F79D2